MSDGNWESWLQAYNRELLARFDPAESGAFLDPLVTPAVLASGWLGTAGASEAQLQALESRLDTTLPPSYRSFLQASNGFLQPGLIVPRLLPAEEVGWYRDRDPESIAIWTEMSAAAAGSPWADPDSFERYLPTAVQISAVETVGTAVYLLNPEVVDADGEWEAFYFAHWIPGADRYPSFWALMEAERSRLLAPPQPLPPGRGQTFLEVVRWIFRRER